MSSVKYVSDETFDNEVLNSDKPVLVDFTASWCGPCQAVSPVLDELAACRDDIKIVKIDVGGNKETKEETNPETRETYNITAFPTLCLFRNEKIADVQLGGGDKKSITKWLDQALAQDITRDMDKEQFFEKLKEKKEQTDKKMNRLILGGVSLFALWKIAKGASGVAATFAGGMKGDPLMLSFGLATCGFTAVDMHDSLMWFGHKERQIVPRLSGVFKKVYKCTEGATYIANGYLLGSFADQTTHFIAEKTLEEIAGVSTLSGILGLGNATLSTFFKKKAAQKSEEEPRQSEEKDSNVICENGVCRLDLDKKDPAP